MLEIAALIFLTRKIGEIVESKNRKAGWFKLMAVLLWIGFEILGGIIGGVYVALTESSEAFIYLFAIIGAIAGAALSIVIAKSVPAVDAALAQPPPPPPSFG